MSQEPLWTSFDPEAGAADGDLALPTEGGSWPVVALLAGDHEEAAGWAPRAALALVRGWAGAGARIVLADLGLDAPALHALVGEDNGEGVVDAVLYGASVQRVAGRPSGERFILIPSGTPVADAERVLSHPRWGTLIAGFQEAGAVLALYVPTSLPGARSLADRCTFRVQLGGEQERGWESRADLRLRPVTPLPSGEDPEPIDEGGEPENVPAPAEAAAPATRPAPHRTTPAPVPREVLMPRILPAPVLRDEGEGRGPDRPGAIAEPSIAEGTPVHEPATWEEADPWDLPELEPLRSQGPPEEQADSGVEWDDSDLPDWSGLEAQVDLPDPRSPEARQEAAPAISGDDLGEFEPRPVPGDDPAEFDPHAIPGDDLPVLPDSGSADLEYEPHAFLGDQPDEPRVDPPAQEEGGSDPFGFLGEWEGGREPEDVPEATGEPAAFTAPSPWDDPVEPWDGVDRSWEETYEAVAGRAGEPESDGEPRTGPVPPDLDAPPAPDAPATWSPREEEAPAGPVARGPGSSEPLAASTGPGPARRPVPRPRQERATGAWLLFLVLLAVAVLLGAARFGLIQIPGVTPPQGDSPPGLGATSTAEAASIEAAPPPVEDLVLVVEPTSPVHVLALALTAFGSAVGARAAADRLQPSVPEHPVMVVPVESGGQVFHRLVVGGATSREEVEELREMLVPLYSGSRPDDWIVREADRAFLLDETASPGEAERRVADLRERGIPAYVLEVPLTDGARLWRVQAGAFGSDAEASTLAELLREAGEGTPTLVPLTGRPPG